MDSFSVGKILAGLRNPEIYLKRLKQVETNTGNNSGFNASLAQPKPNNFTPSAGATAILLQQLQMNQIANMDRAIYIRNLLGLPKTLQEILQATQNQKTSMLLNSLNQDMLQNQKALAEIFGDMNATQNVQAQQTPKDALTLFFSGMIQLPALSELILKNSKDAVASLIIAMASASKGGMTNDQLRETLGIINACVSMADSNNPTQTLKSLMLLYLPWLPLNEEVDFDLEIEKQDGENESNDSKLTVLIQTKNFGNVKGEFTLTTSNSVDILILCSEGFPKKTLQKSLQDESNSFAMNTSIEIEAIQLKEDTKKEKQETKVNLSATNEMNPYLLLIAHAFIRNTIFIDSNGVIEDTSS